MLKQVVTKNGLAVEIPLKGGMYCIMPLGRAVWIARGILALVEELEPKSVKLARKNKVLTKEELMMVFGQPDNALSLKQVIARIGTELSIGQRRASQLLRESKKMGVVYVTGEQRSKALRYHMAEFSAATQKDPVKLDLPF